MSWDEHIKSIRNKITKNLYLLQQIKSFLPVNGRKLYVNSYILPHIDYCCVVWGNCSITLVTSLEKLLKKSARLILDEVVDRQNTTPSQLNRQVYKYKTRAASNHNIHVSHSHTKFFMNLGTQIQNEIPPHIRNSKSLTNFKQLYVQQHFSKT